MMSWRTRWVSAGGEGGDGAVRKEFAEAAELAILGPEFMPPLGNTMGFVDGEEGDGEALQPVHGAAERDALRRQIEQLVFAGGRALEDVGALFGGSGGVQTGGGNSHLQELRYLSCIKAINGEMTTAVVALRTAGN